MNYDADVSWVNFYGSPHGDILGWDPAHSRQRWARRRALIALRLLHQLLSLKVVLHLPLPCLHGYCRPSLVHSSSSLQFSSATLIDNLILLEQWLDFLLYLFVLWTWVWNSECTSIEFEVSFVKRIVYNNMYFSLKMERHGKVIGAIIAFLNAIC